MERLSVQLTLTKKRNLKPEAASRATRLLDPGELQRQTRLLAIGPRLGHRAGLGRLVPRRNNDLQRLGGILLLPGLDCLQILLLQGMQARADAAVVDLLAGAVAHATFGG